MVPFLQLFATFLKFSTSVYGIKIALIVNEYKED